MDPHSRLVDSVMVPLIWFSRRMATIDRKGHF